MVDKMPMLNGLSVKMRAKHFESSKGATTSDEQSSMSKREKNYTGVKQENQKMEHKGPTMSNRAKKYEGLKLAKQSEEHKGAGMAKRAKSYEGLKLAKQSEEHKGAGMAKRAKSYEGLKLAKQSEEHKGAAMSNRAQKYQGKGQQERPYTTNCEFCLEIENKSIACKKISNLSEAREVEEVHEGGNNLFPNVFLSAKKSADRLTIERALVQDEVVSKFRVGKHVSSGSVVLLKEGKEFKRFNFDKGLITRCEYSNLDALGSEVMIYNMEIVHSGLTLADGAK